jgi:hypothetical protein
MDLSFRLRRKRRGSKAMQQVVAVHIEYTALLAYGTHLTSKFNGGLIH